MRTILYMLPLLAACVTPPSQPEIRETGTRFMHPSAMGPKVASACLARAVLNARGDLRVDWHEGLAPGSYVLIVAMNEYTHIVADVTPSTSGSLATIYVQPRMWESLRDPLLAAMRRDC